MQVTKANRKEAIKELNGLGYKIPSTATTKEVRAFVEQSAKGVPKKAKAKKSTPRRVSSEAYEIGDYLKGIIDASGGSSAVFKQTADSGYYAVTNRGASWLKVGEIDKALAGKIPGISATEYKTTVEVRRSRNVQYVGQTPYIGREHELDTRERYED